MFHPRRLEHILFHIIGIQIRPVTFSANDGTQYHKVRIVIQKPYIRFIETCRLYIWLSGAISSALVIPLRFIKMLGAVQVIRKIHIIHHARVAVVQATGGRNAIVRELREKLFYVVIPALTSPALSTATLRWCHGGFGKPRPAQIANLFLGCRDAGNPPTQLPFQ